MDSTAQLQYPVSESHQSGRVNLGRPTIAAVLTKAREPLIGLALVLGAFGQGAFAAEPNCRGIESTGARLSCYDAAFPSKPKESLPVEKSVPRAEYKDPLIAEDAWIAAKLKNICRGC